MKKNNLSQTLGILGISIFIGYLVYGVTYSLNQKTTYSEVLKSEMTILNKKLLNAVSSCYQLDPKHSCSYGSDDYYIEFSINGKIGKIKSQKIFEQVQVGKTYQISYKEKYQESFFTKNYNENYLILELDSI